MDLTFLLLHKNLLISLNQRHLDRKRHLLSLAKETKDLQASMITKDSTLLQVATYVGEKLKNYKFVEDIQKLIEDQAVSGNVFSISMMKSLKDIG